MKDSRQIDANQLMTLMVLFVVASSMLSNVGGGAGQNVWIVLIISSSIFSAIFAVYYRISTLNNHKGLPDILKNCLGKWGGSLSILVYVVYFFIRTLMVGNALTDMVQHTLMYGVGQRLPAMMLLVAVVFGVLYGLKAIGRSSEIFFVIIILCLIPFFATVFSSGVFKFNNLAPVLAQGFIGIRRDILRIVFFPLGELFIFLMFFQFLPKKENNKILKRSYTAILVATILMIAVNSTTVGILGSDLTQNFQYPFYSAMQLAGISGLLARLDPLATVIVIISSYMKAILYFYATTLAIQSLNERFNFKWIVAVISIAIVILEPYIRLEKYKDFHIEVFPFKVLPIFQIAIPLVIWVISEIKNYKKKKNSKNKIDKSSQSVNG